MSRCLYCYQEIENSNEDFHPRCAKKIFDTAVAPLLPYRHTEISELAQGVVRAQIALTGVQPKLSVGIVRSTKKTEPQRFTIVGLWGRYILKPQSDLYESLPQIEDLTMHLAQMAGIRTVNHSLIRFADGELCYITGRIDRGRDGEKFPMEDMCQLNQRMTENKYRGSYEQIAKTILRFSAAPKLDVINFWEQVLFCWLTGNSDMHLKNFSLFKPDNLVWGLAPAYDLVSTALIVVDDEELALTLNGKKRKIKREDFVCAMQSSGLNEKIIENIFSKFCKVQNDWSQLIGVSFLSPMLKLRYAELIESRLRVLGQ